MRTNQAKRILAEGKTTLGTWLSLGSVLAARFMARAGFDWLTVDLEHSPTDWELASTLFAVIADAGCIPLARVPCGSHDHIKRTLDAGAFGIVVPMVMSRAEAELAVRATKYHPHGNRSVGGGAFSLNFQTSNEEYFQKANDEILVVLQCEHIAAAEQFEEIFSVPGIDAVFVGPNDLARSQYSASGQPPSAERQESVLQQILNAGKKVGVPVGLHTFTPQDASRRMQEGWQFIAINSELRFMLDGTAAALAPIRGSGSVQKIY